MYILSHVLGLIIKHPEINIKHKKTSDIDGTKKYKENFDVPTIAILTIWSCYANSTHHY
jgi:hypothetical protein